MFEELPVKRSDDAAQLNHNPLLQPNLESALWVETTEANSSAVPQAQPDPNPQAMAELHLFLLAKKLEAQANLQLAPDVVEEAWAQWMLLADGLEPNEDVADTTALALSTMALYYARRQDTLSMNVYYERLVKLALHDKAPMLVVQRWMNTCTHLSEALSQHHEARRCRLIYDDALEGLSLFGHEASVRLAFMRTVRHVVWAYRDQTSFDRAESLASVSQLLAEKYPADSALRREWARVLVCLTYGYGQQRQWRQGLPTLKLLGDWCQRFPTDRHLRLRWMQVARNLIWGHDGNPTEAMRLHDIFNQMVELYHKYPTHAALRVELGWSCVNMSWTYGSLNKPHMIERTVTLAERLMQQHLGDIELAECYAATCRNWLWALREVPETQALQATVVQRLRTLVAHHPTEDYIRRQTVACVVNYSYAAKRLGDASTLLNDLEWLQTLLHYHPADDTLAQATAEVASNLVETYEHASSTDEAKCHLALINGLVSEHPTDPIIANSLACATSELAWLCQRLNDHKGLLECVALMESATERNPDSVELHKAQASSLLACVAWATERHVVDDAFEFHLKLRYLARRQASQSFFHFCWARSCELIVLAHPHHEPATALGLYLAELEQLKADHPADTDIMTFWVNARLHVLWRMMTQHGDTEAVDNALDALETLLHTTPTSSADPAAVTLPADAVVWLQKVRLAKLWLACHRHETTEAERLMQAMCTSLMQHPKWLASVRLVAQAAVIVWLHYGQQGQTVLAHRHVGRLSLLFKRLSQRYHNVMDAIEAWDHLGRLAFVATFYPAGGSAPTAWQWWLSHHRQVTQAAKHPLSQSVLWRWVPATLQAWQQRAKSETSEGHPKLLTHLLMMQASQFPFDTALMAFLQDWLNLQYVQAVANNQTIEAEILFAQIADWSDVTPTRIKGSS
jgi:hypothetical protein